MEFLTVAVPLGDIVLTPEQQGTLEATSNPNDPFAPQNAVVTMERSLWPNGVVPYVIDNLNSRFAHGQSFSCTCHHMHST